MFFFFNAVILAEAVTCIYACDTNHTTMPSQHSGSWSKSESVAWMEENQEELCICKEQIFSNKEHITIKHITDKAINMKRSGWGVKVEMNETSINETLERKYAFFGSWRNMGVMSECNAYWRQQIYCLTRKGIYLGEWSAVMDAEMLGIGMARKDSRVVAADSQGAIARAKLDRKSVV